MFVELLIEERRACTRFPKTFVHEAKSLGVAEKSTCGFLGITVRTIQNWRNKGLRDKLPPQ